MSDPSTPAPPPPFAARPQAGAWSAFATLVGVVVVLLPLAAPREGVPATLDLGDKLVVLAGYALFALVVWGLLYAITLRRASRRWKIASLAILVAVGLLNGLVSIAGRSGTAKDDARQTARQVEQAMAAGPNAKIEAGAGPIARLTATVGNIGLAERNGFMASSNAAGLPQIVALRGLTPSSPILDDCDRIDALAPRAKALSERYPHYLAAYRSEGAKLIAAGELSQRDIDSLVGVMRASQEPFHRQWTLAAALSGHAGQLCRVLARRQWTNGAGGEVQFTSDADAAEATALRGRMEPIARELDAIQAAARAQSEAALKSLRR